MRLFIAIVPDEAARAHLVGLARRLDRRFGESSSKLSEIRWVPAANLHGTVKFLGEVEDAAVPEVATALKRAAAVPSFTLFASSVTFQPRRGARRLVAVDLDGEVDRLRQLHRTLDEAVGRLGYPRDHRKLWPHVTLGRWRRPVRLTAPVADDLRLPDELFPGPWFRIDRVALMQSVLRPSGAEYAAVTRVKLASSS